MNASAGVRGWPPRGLVRYGDICTLHLGAPIRNLTDGCLIARRLASSHATLATLTGSQLAHTETSSSIPRYTMQSLVFPSTIGLQIDSNRQVMFSSLTLGIKYFLLSATQTLSYFRDLRGNQSMNDRTNGLL